MVVVAVVAAGGPARAADGVAALKPEDVPPALRLWVPWALAGHEAERCPVLGEGGPALCQWAGRLEVAVDAKGGRFAQTITVTAESAVTLPGSRDVWPLDVRVRAGGRKLVVLEGEGEGEVPRVLLPPGQHELSGSFVWRRPPEVLPVPRTTGLLALSVNGREVPFPRRTDEGHLFLAGTAPGEGRGPDAEADTLEVDVHRKVIDDVPLLLITQIDLAVTGKPREVVLAAPLPPGFVAQAIEAQLPARLDPDGKLRVQLRPGQHTLGLVARAPALPAGITRPKPDGTWKVGDEIWVFEARPRLRQVTVAGVVTIDTRQSKLPDAWRSLPAYLVPAGATMRLEQRRRGDAEPAPDRLTLRRRLYLDFDGGGYTVVDRLGGRLERSQRLEMGPGQALGRFVIDGADQPITTLRGTTLGGDSAGVEIRRLDFDAHAEGRIEGQRVHPPAVGWAHDFQNVETTLALPPGWRLFHATGADRVGDSFVRRLSLLDLFLVLVVALAAARLHGAKIGLLALVVMALITKETDAPTWVWLAVLVGDALVRALPAGYLRKTAKVYRLGATFVLVLLAFPFAVAQVNRVLHPALDEAEVRGYAHGAGSGQDFALLNPTADRDESVMYKAAPEEAPRPAPSPPKRVRKSMKGEAAKADRRVEMAEALAEAGADSGIANLQGGISGAGSLRGLSGGGSLGAAAPAAPPPAQVAAPPPLATYDPNAEVQTGPGIPRWEGSTVELGWNGPVEKSAHLSLWLIPPWLEQALGGLRVLLMGVFIVFLLRGALAAFGRLLPPAGVLSLALVALALDAAAPAHAQELPSNELLGELRARLSKPPACHPRCASFGRLTVVAAPDRVSLRLEADALATTSVPLPGLAAQWSPAVVTLDGRPAPALHRDGEGRLWLLLPAGPHVIGLEGPPGNRASVPIPFGALRPHAVTATLRGFELAGLGEDGSVRDSIELVRGPQGGAAAPAAGDDGAASTLPPFLSVVRTLSLGLDFKVRTEVIRATPLGTAVVGEVALLPGESVLTPGIKVIAGKVPINMGPGDASTSWSSVLAQKSPIDLKAPAGNGPVAATEVWRLDAGPQWHVRTTGIPAVHPDPGEERRVPVWQPWPGEAVSIAVERPKGLKSTHSTTLTLDDSNLSLHPGARSTEARLLLTARTSRGIDHAVTLPEGATLTSVSIDGREQTVRQEGRKVIVALTPGRQQIAVAFQAPGGLAPLYRVPRVDLGAPSVNATVELNLAADRWLLWSFGPRLGPAVLLPSMILVVLVIGFALGRARVLPLRTHQLVLLGLGFLPLSLGAAAAVLGYLLALGFRRTYLRTRFGWLHDLVQVALAIYTVLAVAILFLVVREGLLASPDMDVVGNGSSATLLRWTVDRSEGLTPAAGALSLPLGAYHVAMLAWGLWLAVAVIRWAPWVWSCLTAGGLWRPLFASGSPTGGGPTETDLPTVASPGDTERK